MSNTYYKPLATGALFRVLELCPSSVSENVSLRLTEHHAIKGFGYEALSYTWDENFVTVILDGRPFQITENLYAALVSLRRPDQPRYLWVDAVCINQRDNTEKSYQIRQMLEIYSLAERVIVWLGEADESTERALQYARAVIVPVQQQQRRQKLDYTRQGQKALLRLLRRRWWRRIWVIQEVSVGKQVTVRCGHHEIPWNELREAATCLEREVKPPNHALFEQVIDFRDNKRHNLFEAATLHQDFEATQQNDKLYALVGLADKHSKPRLHVDYNRKTDELFLTWAMDCLREFRNLDILGSVSRNSDLQLPSWVPDWTPRSAYSLSMNQLFSDWTPRFSASLNTQLALVPAQGDTSLRLAGYEVDSIGQVGSVWRFDTLDKPHATDSMEYISRHSRVLLQLLECESIGRLRHSGATYPTGESIRDVYWQVLCGGCNASKFSEVKEEFQQFDETMQVLIPLHKLRLSTSSPVVYTLIVGVFVRRALLHKVPRVNWSRIPDRDLTWAFQKRWAFMQGRAIARTKKGFLGLVPATAKVGDGIWLLRGSKVPLILTPEGPKRPSVYRFQGEAYIHGMMLGEQFVDEMCERISVE